MPSLMNGTDEEGPIFNPKKCCHEKEIAAIGRIKEHFLGILGKHIGMPALSIYHIYSACT